MIWSPMPQFFLAVLHYNCNTFQLFEMNHLTCIDHNAKHKTIQRMSLIYSINDAHSVINYADLSPNSTTATSPNFSCNSRRQVTDFS